MLPVEVSPQGCARGKKGLSELSSVVPEACPTDGDSHLHPGAIPSAGPAQIAQLPLHYGPRQCKAIWLPTRLGRCPHPALSQMGWGGGGGRHQEWMQEELMLLQVPLFPYWHYT